MSNYRYATIKDMRTWCIAAKNLGKLGHVHNLRPYNDNLMLSCKLTETKWYDKIDPENSFYHQPIERWSASTNSAPSPWETSQIRKQVCEKWQFGADGPAECPQNESQPRVAVAITDDGAVSDTVRASGWFYRNNDEVSPKVIPPFLTGTTTTSFNPNSDAISTRTFRVRIDLVNILIPGEHIELDFPHLVVVSMPDNSQALVGRVVTERKRDATPHNRYLAPDNLGVIEAVCPQAMAFIVRVPLNQRLTFIRFWDAQFVGELSACLHYRICNDSAFCCSNAGWARL